jgi:hypothetical protein
VAGATASGGVAGASRSAPPAAHTFPVYNPQDGSFFRDVHPSPGNERGFVAALNLSTYQLSYSSIITKSTNSNNSEYQAIYTMEGDHYAGKSINGARFGSFDNSRMFSASLNFNNSENTTKAYYSDVAVGVSPNGDLDTYYFGLDTDGNNPLTSFPFQNSYNSTIGEAYVFKRRESAVNWDTYFGPAAASSQKDPWNNSTGQNNWFTNNFEISTSKGKMAYSNQSHTLFLAASSNLTTPSKSYPGYFTETVNNNSGGMRSDIYLAAFSSRNNSHSNYFNWGTMYGGSCSGCGALGKIFGKDYLSAINLYDDGVEEYLYVLATSASSNGSIVSDVENFPVADLGLTNSYFQQNNGGDFDIVLSRFKVTDINQGLSLNDEGIRSPFKLFPNPSQGRFTIQTFPNNGVEHLVVYNLQGVLVHKQTLLKPLETLVLDLSHLARGLYLIEINHQNAQRILIH